jgi:hypothetical protein
VLVSGAALHDFEGTPVGDIVAFQWDPDTAAFEPRPAGDKRTDPTLSSIGEPRSALPQASWTLLGQTSSLGWRVVGAISGGTMFYSAVAVGSGGEGDW